MSFTHFDFPHSHYYDTDLRELIVHVMGLEEEYEALEKRVAQNEADIVTLYAKAAELKEAIEALETWVKNEIATFEQQVKDDFEALTTEFNEKFEDLSNEFDEKFATLQAELKQELTTMQTALEAELKALEDELKADFAELQEAVNTRLNEFESIIDNKIAEMETKVDEKIQELTDEVNAAVTKIENTITEINEKFQVMQDTMTQRFSDFETLINGNYNKSLLYTDEKAQELQEQIDNITIDPTERVNVPALAKRLFDKKTVQVAFDMEHAWLRSWAWKAKEYNQHRISASKWQELTKQGMTAYEYGYRGKWWTFDRDKLLFDSIIQTVELVKETFGYGLTANEYAAKDWTATDYNGLNLTAYQYATYHENV